MANSRQCNVLDFTDTTCPFFFKSMAQRGRTVSSDFNCQDQDADNVWREHCNENASLNNKQCLKKQDKSRTHLFRVLSHGTGRVGLLTRNLGFDAETTQCSSKELIVSALVSSCVIRSSIIFCKLKKEQLHQENGFCGQCPTWMKTFWNSHKLSHYYGFFYTIS